MEQMVSKIDKKPKWSVLVTIKSEVFKGRIFSRRKGVSIRRIRDANTLVEEEHEYLYLNVTKMYKKGHILHIHIGKAEHHMHDLQRVISIQAREYKRSGIQ
jgi:deoxyadenosine/deoxycytidine kinase